MTYNGYWPAFTNGATTWLGGPYGIQSRGNGEWFFWEWGQFAGGDAHAALPCAVSEFPAPAASSPQCATHTPTQTDFSKFMNSRGVNDIYPGPPGTEQLVLRGSSANGIVTWQRFTGERAYGYEPPAYYRLIGAVGNVAWARPIAALGEGPMTFQLNADGSLSASPASPQPYDTNIYDGNMFHLSVPLGGGAPRMELFPEQRVGNGSASITRNVEA